MDEATAQNIVRTSIRVMALLDQLAGDLQGTLPEPVFDAERRRIGGIMEQIAIDLIRPAMKLHQSLDVTSEEAWRRVGELETPHWLKTFDKI